MPTLLPADALGTHLPFHLSEYERRWALLDKELERLGYEVALIWGRSGGSYDRAGSLSYLTNFGSHASGQEWSSGLAAIGRAFAVLIVRRGHEPELHIAEPVSTVEPRYIAVQSVQEHLEDLPSGVARRLKQLGVEGPVAYLGDDFLPAQMYRLLTDATPEITWVAEEYLLHQAQSQKSEVELNLYREAGEVAARALRAFIEGLRTGERQCDAAAKAASIIISNGGGFQRVGCHTGPRSELAMWDNPLYGYSDQRAAVGDMVRAWVYGPIRHGYWIDPGRSSVRGRPTPRQRRLVEAGVDLTEHLIAGVRTGVTPRTIGIMGDEYAKRIGFGDDMGGAIWDIYGHGLSTFFHPPVIPAHGAAAVPTDPGFNDVDRPFHEGQVFTVETFIRDPGVGTATFEEVFIVRDDGVERLTDGAPMTFW